MGKLRFHFIYLFGFWRFTNTDKESLKALHLESIFSISTSLVVPDVGGLRCPILSGITVRCLSVKIKFKFEIRTLEKFSSKTLPTENFRF